MTDDLDESRNVWKRVVPEPAPATEEETALVRLAQELRQAASQCIFEVQTEVYPGAAGVLFRRAAEAIEQLSTHIPSTSLGLSVDMLDVDRLQGWANKIEEYGADIGHWSDPKFVVAWLRTFTGRLDEAVRDIGTLRAALPAPALHGETDEQRARQVAEVLHKDGSLSVSVSRDRAAKTILFAFTVIRAELAKVTAERDYLSGAVGEATVDLDKADAFRRGAWFALEWQAGRYPNPPSTLVLEHLDDERAALSAPVPALPSTIERLHSADCRLQEAQHQREADALQSGFELGKAAHVPALTEQALRERAREFVMAKTPLTATNSAVLDALVGFVHSLASEGT